MAKQLNENVRALREPGGTISKVPAAGWAQIAAYAAFCETSQDQSPGAPAAAGDFGFKLRRCARGWRKRGKGRA